MVVDNASIDDTKKIVMEFCRKYPVVKYEYEPISGLTYARKHAAYMSSEWVAFLDDDNIVTENWLVQMMGFIKSNNLLGVCNSACIATPAVKFSEREMSILYAVAPGLACTHACMESYVHNDPPMISTPFGAGMFIRTRQLKRYLEEGWTTSIGRTKDNLASGEDGEIARAVLKQGFSYGYNNKAAILHIIPHRRIEDDYLVRLSEGLDEGYYRFLRSQKYALIKLMMVFSKNCRPPPPISIIFILRPSFCWFIL